MIEITPDMCYEHASEEILVIAGKPAITLNGLRKVIKKLKELEAQEIARAEQIAADLGIVPFEPIDFDNIEPIEF